MSARPPVSPLSPTQAQRASQVVGHLIGSPRSPSSGMQTERNVTAAAAASTSAPASAGSVPSRPLPPYSTPTPLFPSEPHLLLRRLEASDYSKGHVQLLAQLSDVGSVSREEYEERVEYMQHHCGGMITTLVVEDTQRGCIVASATLISEPKLLHSCSRAGHIEDVVVSDGYRGRALGLRIVQALHEVARHTGCYKVMLDCKESNAAFYEKMGYKPNQMHMRLDL